MFRGKDPISRQDLLSLVLLGIAALMLIVGLVAAYADPNILGVLHCGDFPGFYVLAEIQARGLTHRLYDMSLQADIENELFSECVHGGYFASLYPPYFALVLRPLAALAPLAAGYMFRVLCAVALLWSIVAARPLLRQKQITLWLVLALLMLPLTASIVGGQMTAVVILLLLLAARALHDRRDVAAGILCALLLIKPQYGVFALAALAVVSTRRALVAAAFTALVEYVAGAYLLGWLWPQPWLAELTAFGSRNYLFNSAHQISLFGATQGLLVLTNAAPATVTLCLGLAAVGSLVALALFLRALWQGRGDPGRAFLLVGPAITILSPQTLYYDVAIGTLALLPLVSIARDRSREAVLGVLLLCGTLTLIFPLQPYPIFLPVAVLLFGLSLKHKPYQSALQNRAAVA